MIQNTKYKLTIGWLYPDLMSTYGDRGNILVFQKRCEWRDIEVNILRVEKETDIKELKKVDLIFGGGAQDREQSIVIKDLQGEKGNMIKELIENNTPALFVCGSPQLMGKYYEPGEGEQIDGLGIFDMISHHAGKNKPRLIGNVVARTKLTDPDLSTIIVGFENHGGRTYLGETGKQFAEVIKGNGNNGEDETEGVIYKNAIGCYFHGPLLPKNPEVADWLIQKALAVKYKEKINLVKLDDALEEKAKIEIAKRLGITV